MSAGRLLFAKRRLWTPYDIPRSVLKAWWNADDHASSVLMTDDGAGLISSWTDRINGLAVTAATTARPTWASNSFNSSYAGVTFDGAANVMTEAALSALIPSAAVPGTLWAVAAPVTPDTAVSLRNPISYGGNNTGSRRQIEHSASNFATANAPRASDSGGTLTITGTASSWISAAIVMGQYDATTVTGYLNGTTFGTSGAGTLSTTATRLRIGAVALTAVAGFFNGPIRHVLITTALTTLQRQQLEGWLAWDSGLQSLLPASHPFKSVPP